MADGLMRLLLVEVAAVVLRGGEEL